jgi:hypothetical protein
MNAAVRVVGFTVPPDVAASFTLDARDLSSRPNVLQLIGDSGTELQSNDAPILDALVPGWSDL